MKANALRRGMNLWPPLLFAGIRIRHISDDFRAVDVELHERFYNKNYVGCHFGGSLFAMTDPFWMLMVMRNLDRSYTVWDKSAGIEFLRPGRGTVSARFRLTEDMLDDIRANTAEEGARYLRSFPVDIVNTDGDPVARVTKTLHIRRKPDTETASAADEPQTPRIASIKPALQWSHAHLRQYQIIYIKHLEY